MISFEKALKIADSYYKKSNNEKVIKALESEYVWIFYGGDENKIEVGGVGITVDKMTGEIADFILPLPENLLLLKNAKSIDLSMY